MKKKILISSVMIVGIVALIIGVTTSFFSDTEVSTGNVFTAGDFDLMIDSTCTYNGQTQTFCTWVEKNLDGDLFFNFGDIKPSDSGEDTISFHIIDNDAWLCAEVYNLVNKDNGCRTPETLAPDLTCGDPGIGEGELQDNLFFTVWQDTNCDNVLDSGEVVIIQDQPASDLVWTIADSTTGNPIPGDTTVCYGLAWNVPLVTNNIIQSDSLTGDIKFTAVQARGMTDFKCSDLTDEIGGDTGCVLDADCDDNLYCNGVETCSPEGVCLVSSGDPCPGQNVGPNCSDSCNESSDDCTADDGDGVSCTGGFCQSGMCVPVCTPTTEVCDGVDNDCDLQVDEDAVCGTCVWSVEVCDGKDNDCDGQVDEGNPGGGASCSTGLPGICELGIMVCNNGGLQCVQSIQPTTEVCDGLDNDCDGSVDEGVTTTYYRDADDDGYGNLANNIQACSVPAGYVTNDDDCNDTNSSIHPDALEICDGVDNDCDGIVDEGCQQLSAAVTGSGGGHILATGINCPTDCSESYPAGTAVTLTASPNSGAQFSGWTGACTGNSSCTLTMDAAKSVTASFAYPLNVTKAGTGSGTVNSSPAGISCGATCSYYFPYVSLVTLTATPDPGSTFAGWTSGVCSIYGTGNCPLSMNMVINTTATFNQQN